MINNLIVQLILPLIITEIVEVGVAALFGLRHKLEIAAILLINIITNPLMNFILLLNFSFHIVSQNLLLLTSLEIIVVFVEWLLLKWVLQSNSKKLFLLSIVRKLLS